VRRRQNEPRVTGGTGASAGMIPILPQPRRAEHFRAAVFHVVDVSDLPVRRLARAGAHARATGDRMGFVSEPIQPSELDDLVVRMAGVGVRRGTNDLLAGLDWNVELDERWVVLGPNGAGKTTLLRLAAAELHPTTGEVDLLGERIGRVNIFDLRPRIGFTSAAIAQRVPGDELVKDVVVSAGYAVLGRWREAYDALDTERAGELLAAMGVGHLADRTFGTLSEGERKRALIARSLMTDPEMLLLDEPAAGLDLGGREDLVARLSALALDPEAPAMVLVTHHVEEIPPGFTHALLLRDGRAVVAGLVDDVVTGENLSKTFDQDLILERSGDRFFARRR
jgi:iron complex transport system ATP-binding protein